MDILQTFGINWYLVIAQIVNFLLILYVLKRFVYKPIFDMLKKREDIVKKSVDDAKTAKEALENAEKERKRIIKKANDEARIIVEDAKSSSREILIAASEKAKRESATTLQDAQEQIERDARSAEKKIYSHIGSIIEKIMRDALRGYLTENEQKEILAKTMLLVSKQS